VGQAVAVLEDQAVGQAVAVLEDQAVEVTATNGYQ